MKKQKTLLGSPHGKDNSAFNSSKKSSCWCWICYHLPSMSFRDYLPPQFLNSVIWEKKTAKNEEPPTNLILYSDFASLISHGVILGCSFRLWLKEVEVSSSTGSSIIFSIVFHHLLHCSRRRKTVPLPSQQIVD
ncbi:unnamed protein product [Rhodiola kirilowii]